MKAATGRRRAIAKALTALLHAARQGYLEAATALLDGGADINKTQAGDNTSPLLTAVINGQFDMAMLLIQRGADPNITASNNGVSPLWAAVNTAWQPRTRFPQPQEMEQQKATYLDVMKALLDAGADPDARVRTHPWFLVYSGCGNRNCGLADTSGSTAFWRSAYGVDVDAMKLLVQYGADPNIPTTAPAIAVRRGGANAPPPGAGGSSRQTGAGWSPWRSSGWGSPSRCSPSPRSTSTRRWPACSSGPASSW